MTAVSSNKQALRAVARLHRDFEELKASAAELPFVAAAPLSALSSDSKRGSGAVSGWLTWRVVIMGPPSTRFAGVLLHVELAFPPSYPAKGPRATLKSHAAHGAFRHAHVYGDWVCLSILEDYIADWGEAPLAKDQG